MKTWEMIKALTENPNLKFVCEKQPNNPVSIIDGILCWSSGSPMGLNFESFAKVGTIDRYEWELAREPVDFMTAVNGTKRIKPIGRDVWDTPGEWLRNRVMTLEWVNGKWLIE